MIVYNITSGAHAKCSILSRSLEAKILSTSIGVKKIEAISEIEK
jgi:hypothetical protein